MPEPAQRVAYTTTDKAGAASVMLGASLWGLFWIPLRFLDNAGINGLWAIALVLIFALFPALVLTAIRGESSSLLQFETWWVGGALGLATTLYFAAVLYSDVVRVIFLFYLLPVWTTLAARIICAEPIRGIKLLVIGIALAGLWLLLGGNRALPYPQNPGDWAAIGAGLCWGVSLAMLRGRQHTAAHASTVTALSVAIMLSMVGALVSTALFNDASSTTPAWAAIEPVLLISIAFGMLAIFPAMLGQIWGARRIAAPTAALLTMSEIIVATVSASLLIGTELDSLAWLGGLLIVLSVCLDLYAQFRGDGAAAPRN